jgi:hypothetical protein
VSTPSGVSCRWNSLRSRDMTVRPAGAQVTLCVNEISEHVSPCARN